MKKPLQKEIDLIKDILELSIDELIERNSDIFNHAEEVIRLNRKLHETTINHRLAFYIEKYCQNQNNVIAILF